MNSTDRELIFLKAQIDDIIKELDEKTIMKFIVRDIVPKSLFTHKNKFIRQALAAMDRYTDLFAEDESAMVRVMVAQETKDVNILEKLKKDTDPFVSHVANLRDENYKY